MNGIPQSVSDAWSKSEAYRHAEYMNWDNDELREKYNTLRTQWYDHYIYLYGRWKDGYPV
jgi:hypothetical protein